jgi:hypothetical protein
VCVRFHLIKKRWSLFAICISTIRTKLTWLVVHTVSTKFYRNPLSGFGDVTLWWTCRHVLNIICVCFIHFMQRKHKNKLNIPALSPNVVVECLTLLLRIRVFTGSNLDPETGYLEFFAVSSVSPGECWVSTFKLGHDRFHPNPFQFIIQLSSFHPTLYSPSYCKSVVQ